MAAYLIEWRDYIHDKQGAVVAKNQQELKEILNINFGCISQTIRKVIRDGYHYGRFQRFHVSKLLDYSPRYIVMDEWGRLRVMQKPVSGKKIMYCFDAGIADDVMGFTKKSGRKNFKLPNYPSPHKDLDTAAMVWICKVMKYAEQKYQPHQLRQLDYFPSSQDDQ